MTRADLQRSGVHEKRGVETLSRMIRITAGHDLCHLDQMTRYLQAAQQTK